MHKSSIDPGKVSALTASLWNRAFLGRYQLNFPPIPLKSLPYKTGQRDEQFQKRGGVLMLFNETARAPALDYKNIQITDFRLNGRPSMPLMAMEYAQLLDIEPKSPEYEALLLVATRAEMDEYRADKPAYHNPHHYADVFATMANFFLYARDRGMYFFNKRQEMCGLIAAMGHDIGHNGQANPTDEPYYNEMAAFKIIEPLMQHAGMSADDIESVKIMFKATSPNGPHQIVKALAKAELEQRSVDSWDEVDPERRFEDLEPLASNPYHLMMCAMLSDADLFAGAGVDLETQITVSALLTQESHTSGAATDFTTPQARMAFFDHVVGQDGFASEVGRHFGNDNYQAMREQTQKEMSLRP